MVELSIIIATYNSGKTLKSCLDSIVTQLGNDGEILVIDGGSVDNTINIVESYGSKIAYCVSEPDRGVYDAWNKGIEKAQGEWITFIGSDDEMLPNTLNLYREAIKKYPDRDIISGKLHFCKQDGSVIRDVGEPWNWNKFIHRKMSLAHPGMLHNKKCFERVGLFDTRYRICADSDFLQRLGPHTKAAFIDEFLVNMSEGGISDSMEALKEGYLSRKRNKVLSPIENYFYYISIILRMKLGKIRNYVRMH